MTSYIHRVSFEYEIEADTLSKAGAIAEANFMEVAEAFDAKSIVWTEAISEIAPSTYELNEYGTPWTATAEIEED